MNNTRWLAIAPFVLVLLVCVYQALITLQHNLSFTRLEAEVSFWGRDNYQPTPAIRERTEQSLAWLVAAAPGHPGYLTLRANQLAWESYWAADKVSRTTRAQSAYQMQLNALQHRPAHRQDWAKLVKYAYGLVNGEALTKSARARQQALQPVVEKH
jgi:hypothetical protein